MFEKYFILLIVLIGISSAQEQVQTVPEPIPVAAPESIRFIPTQETQFAPTQSLVPAVPVPNSYERLLDTIKFVTNSILPEKARFDALKETVNSETAAPKDEYEKQADYEKRLENFGKTREQKISNLEKEYQIKIKNSLDKLRSGINGKQDLQPNWAGMLRREGSIEEFKERINKFKEKISEMKGEISQITELLERLGLSSGETKTLMDNWQKKNLRYITRLEKACELMQDYILQEQTKVLSTGKRNFEMNLGNYNPEKEEFEFAMSDTISKTLPFNYGGTIKISSQQAREINRKTDDFTASVDYINYPFIVDGAKLYLGAVKAHVFYKDNEVLGNGVFKSIQSYERMNGYADWAVRADSMIRGKLAPKKLDSLYAMQAKIETNIASVNSIVSGNDSPKESKSSFLTKGNVFRAIMITTAASLVGIGALKDQEVSSKMDDGNIEEAKDREKIRNRCYIGAGVAGAAFAVSFFF
ncbi:MAG: hypothetical protein LBH25_04500 [Fibromonadaceae bacterium]|jgi:hypothetical protein|nr:hypothetical protein [Fibromonadaceae bacterium]